jgi:hypothetical protein
MGAKEGPNVLFCLSIRTNCVLLVSAMPLAAWLPAVRG